jgi:hypothetical protein
MEFTDTKRLDNNMCSDHVFPNEAMSVVWTQLNFTLGLFLHENRGFFHCMNPSTSPSPSPGISSSVPVIITTLKPGFSTRKKQLCASCPSITGE